ncbi:MAG: biotin--[acetyl-CoA-carboxylase] ligase [Candidatus Latescibacteria bacterium]|nr:biotin--[acetyl-CoA-carboxylase] ligase [Candidatus Latescibacterota bacterium]
MKRLYNKGIRFGHTIYVYREIDSTQNKAQELAREGATEGIIIFATTQKKGRGRESKVWVSDKGGLYFSIIYCPNISLTDASALTKTIGLIIKRAIENIVSKFMTIELKVKGVNDLMLNNRKVAGILVETTTTGSERPDFYIIGIGININQKHFPRHYESIATSLQLETGRKFSRYKILKAICETLSISLPE